eukprot:339760-Lingulodinium_polyedra.AAC.1
MPPPQGKWAPTAGPAHLAGLLGPHPGQRAPRFHGRGAGQGAPPRQPQCTARAPQRPRLGR